MITLDDLIQETDKKKLNETLKRAFSAIADLLVIDGREPEALTFLVNRTITGQKEFLDDESLALLEDPVWRNGILKTARWIHTHNLKYPYSRVDDCIFFYEEDLRRREHKIFGYAKDSKQINRCQFLVTEFIWKGTVTSLVEQFAFYGETDDSLVDLLVDIGFPKDAIPVFQGQCAEALRTRLPDTVHWHSKQVRFFQGNGEMIAVTPVVSTGTQRIVHNLTKQPDIYGATVFHHRPSSLGNLISACGGRVRCLNYPPMLGSEDRSIDYLIQQWRQKQHLLNEQALFSKSIFHLLFEILTSKEKFSTFQAQKEGKTKQNQQLQQLMAGLFSEIDFLKSRPVAEHSELLRAMDGSIEKKVIIGCFDHEQAANHFTCQIHELLEKSKHSQTLAYEPVLIDAVANGVRIFLSKPQLAIQRGDRIYLHFERLLAYGANCQSNPYLIGVPSLTAFAGFVDALLARLGVKAGKPFAIALRQFSKIKGHPLPKQVYKKRVVKNDSVIDSQHCNMEFDVFIELGFADPALDLSERNLYRCLPRRFAGGVLSSPIIGTYQQSSLYKKCNIYCNDDELSFGISRLPSYARFLADFLTPTHHETLHQLLDVVKTAYGVVPINKGFKYLGTPYQRENAIAPLHSYAEPVLGLIELQSPHRVAAGTEVKERVFWSLQASEDAIKLLSGGSHDRAL
ncbi:hypothetical protein [Endozoicomonas sp. YOMI1]|uniref:hypothetical protein n=1 Tax=Endozoicomonas sp. YOMI1 TaxID=2828739 RepID=UPI00214753C2|nr:hypothetical protein [Endozoicomonas sp. YOMI1]